MKRLTDFLAAILGLIIAFPVMMVIAIVIRRTSFGPAFFVQTRVGLHEKPFKCLKFRTMAFGTPDVASHDAATAWITPLGKRLRLYKLDELPQLINVLKGDMSLVGPRPCLPQQSEVISERRKLAVFDVRPGITGIAQLAGIDMSEPDRLAVADRAYIDNQSILGDLAILARTVLGGGTGDAASKLP
ncbi:sugar transferase [Agrobacterium sp. Azo12]|jgi:O-antigen biosynthesis protein WbqP|uniref:sugar transferase n=1 Tax=Agrobacterium sp. Azo12 TaxID=3031129 RepID=UPI0023D808D2|nr:sugar transferase [Agrobacterium sp. Azo12]MDO5896962.1 sugar transferase [Agrobacterium sp. Azo12]